MTAERSRPPAPTKTQTTADFVESLTCLRQWAGEPSLSRLRTLGGQTAAPDGSMIDRLPKSTVSHVLRQSDKLPRWDFVEAFVISCLRYGGFEDERIPEELEHWRAARAALAGQTPARSTTMEAGPIHRPEQDHAVELLARRVTREEDRARKGLLGGYSIAPVAFGARTDGTKEDLHSIGRFFGDLPLGRLLIVGESGAGKTVLAIELVLQLLERRVPMVPVRLSAARWTRGSRFESWLADQLVQDFGLSAKDAVRLVHDRQVLPVLDGLDELDRGPSTAPPHRAIGLLTELNRYSDSSGRRPGAVVVTCRADRHAELSQAGAGLQGATLLHLHDLTTGQINAYLRSRWPDGHPCEAHRDGIHAALSGVSGKTVQNALATPWRLLLTVTAVESGADPADLLRVVPGTDPHEEAARIARRLIEAYVPAATELAPRSAHGTPYSPEQVRSWLIHLATHLRWQSGHAAGLERPPPGLTAIDIVPHLLWPIGGRRLVRALHGLSCAVFAVVAMLAFWTGSALERSSDLAGGLTLALMTSWVCLATGLSLLPWPTAAGGRSNIPRRLRVIGGLLGGLAGGTVGTFGGLGGLALTGSRVFGLAFAVVAGTTGGAALGTVIGVTAAGHRRAERMTVPEAICAAPLTLLGFGLCGALTGLPPLRFAHADPLPLAAGVAAASVLAFALGVAFTIATGGWSEDAELAHPREALHRNPTIGVAFGLTGGVAAFVVFVMNQDVITSLACAIIGGITFGLAFGAIAWSRAMIGLVVAAARGRLPLRLWTFLDWAYEARLLRISGATYQFRHRELQDFLTSTHEELNQ